MHKAIGDPAMPDAVRRMRVHETVELSCTIVPCYMHKHEHHEAFFCTGSCPVAD